MNYGLKTSICFLILLFGQSQAALAVEETSQPIRMATGPEPPDGGGPVSCVSDGTCNINGCQETPDPDCELPSIPKNVALTISRYTTSTLTNANADAILAKATNTLQTNNEPGDVACDVTFTRNGGVSVFSTGDGNIDNLADFNTIIGLPGYVKVVNLINWCNGNLTAAVGCSTIGGSSLVVERITTLHKEGILWAHEYGHTQGLPDRVIANYVMSGGITAKSTRVNSTECDAYHN
jgi:hypothetical protein